MKPSDHDLPDSPDLYKIEKVSERTCAVVYKPEDRILCYVPAREDCPNIDARYQASMIADAMNATVDMCSIDIAELLESFEAYNGYRYHSDWRPQNDES